MLTKKKINQVIKMIMFLDLNLKEKLLKYQIQKIQKNGLKLWEYHLILNLL